MKHTLSLTRVMFRHTLQSSLSKSFGKRTKKGVAIALGVFLTLYLGGAVGMLSFYLIDFFVSINQMGLLLLMLFAAMSVFITFISLFSLPSLLYFSKDTERYLVLPVSTRSVMSAKLITSYISTLLLTFFVTIPFGISFVIAAQPSLLTLFFYGLATLVVPIIPLFIAVIITVLVFRFIPFVKNKELFTYLSTAIGLGFSLVIVFATTGSNIERIGDILMSVQTGDDQLVRLIGMFLPTAQWLALSTTENNIIYFLLTLALTIVIVVASVLVLEGPYAYAVVNVNEKSGKKRKVNDGQNYARSIKSSRMHSLISYDMRNILRSPTFMMNYFASFIIIPFAMLIPMLSGSSLSAIMSMFYDFTDFFDTIPLHIMIIAAIGIGFLVSFFISSFTTLTSTAISREGQSLYSMQSMPISLMDIINAKITLSTLLMGIIPILLGLTLFIILKLNIFYVLLFIIGGLLGTLSGSILSILPDVYAPKLNWESEQEAVKQNFMAIIPMFGIMTLVGLIAFMMFQVGFTVGIPVGVSAILILTGLAYLLIRKLARTRLVDILEKQ